MDINTVFIDRVIIKLVGRAASVNVASKQLYFTKLFVVFKSTTDYTCIPNLPKLEDKKMLENCKKRAREEISKYENRRFLEVYSKGYNLVA